MIIFRFFLYGSAAFFVLAKCLQGPIETALYLAAAGGVTSTLSCLAVLGMVRICKELSHYE
ncbi:hypothetical protein [Shewanella sedimentimangrovi]|uniref:Uncharacterized protein n=1 Tax=Shewanella sedimentimangrovi TaxID=2814293 RepID=A0ABX7R2J3_9GAMM|nr:hypothetical protein [Shewanella sedimentimangrovi]QSX37288.1 hypothetical protein JYB85_00030 [Shewanella sedimentimangrovi]